MRSAGGPVVSRWWWGQFLMCMLVLCCVGDMYCDAVLGMRHSVAVSVGALAIACDRCRPRSDYTACRVGLYRFTMGAVMVCAQNDT